jgi:hypothetical protein
MVGREVGEKEKSVLGGGEWMCEGGGNPEEREGWGEGKECNVDYFKILCSKFSFY